MSAIEGEDEEEEEEVHVEERVPPNHPEPTKSECSLLITDARMGEIE